MLSDEEELEPGATSSRATLLPDACHKEHAVRAPAASSPGSRFMTSTGRRKVALLLAAMLGLLLGAARFGRAGSRLSSSRGFRRPAATIGLEANATAAARSALVRMTAAATVDGQCSSYEENCFFTKCCDDPIAKCYEKYEGWAACKLNCDAGKVDLQEPKEMQLPWSCRVLMPDRQSLEPEFLPAQTPPPGDGCTATMGACAESRCCSSPGDKCFQKHKRWAVCKPDCVPGINASDPPYAQSPWSCKVLRPLVDSEAAAPHSEQDAFESAPVPPVAALTAEQEDDDDEENQVEIARRRKEGLCSGAGEDCQVFKCCVDPQLSCIVADNSWAVCKDRCTDGTATQGGCEVLQPESSSARTPEGSPFNHKPTTHPEHTIVSTTTASLAPAPTPAPEPVPCAESGKACTDSGCCTKPNEKCFEKDAGFAMCKDSCSPGIDWREPKNLQTPWNCKVLTSGLNLGDKALHLHLPQPPHSGLNTLYCFALMLPRTYEVSLLSSQLKKGVGIYECDAYAVYSNETVELSPGPPVKIRSSVMEGSLYCKKGGRFNTVLNSEIFARLWKQVFHDRQYMEYDWTVKVDPDAVFLAPRLRLHLSKANSADRVYFNNCKDGLHGPIEVISRGGMEVYGKGIDHCVSTLAFEFGTFGEDVFLRHCLGLLEVNRVDDFQLLTEVFGGHLPKCVSGAISFHPLKTTKSYFTCLAQAVAVSS